MLFFSPVIFPLTVISAAIIVLKGPPLLFWRLLCTYADYFGYLWHNLLAKSSMI
jgi:hypothetical protein